MFPGAQSLDVTGPSEVFATATQLSHGVSGRVAYEVLLVAAEAAPVETSSGIEICASRALREVKGPIDTLVVAGGVGSREAACDEALVEDVRALARRARRVASVCTGTFVLAATGLLDGKRATTHWIACAELARQHPRIEVDPDPIFVKDGKLYSSAGVTAGMDLALALVEEDHGRDLSLQVARHLVFFLKRPGSQSQFSAALAAQQAEREPLRDVQGWMADHLGGDLSVARLARRAAMSPRNFARVFSAEVGMTPARYVEKLRIEAARRQLEESSAGVDAVASRCGFGSAEVMRRAFLRSLRVSPTDYRRRFRA